MSRLKIAVLCGGTNEEREVSLSSAAKIAPALRNAGHTVDVLDIGANWLIAPGDEAPQLSADADHVISGSTVTSTGVAMQRSRMPDHIRQFDLAFLAFHGGAGEDGRVQAMLDLMAVPYTGSGHVASAICMDKDLSKQLLRAAGIATPDWTLLARGSVVQPSNFRYPCVVKPNRQGSTVGLSVVRSSADLVAAIEFAFRFDSEVLIEQFIKGRELTVGVLDNRPLAVGEIFIDAESAFDYHDKYTPGAVKEEFPADLPPELVGLIQQTALAAHRVLKLRDYSRADFRLDTDGKLWLLELNSLPGLTETSLLPQSARAAGIDFVQLCESICELAMKWHSQRRDASR